MKRPLSALAALFLTLVLCLTALAEAYTHPTAGYGFTIPAGWFAVDGDNAESLLTRLSHDATMSEMIRTQMEQLKNMPIVMLFEKEKVSARFTNNVNVTVEDLGMKMDIAEMIAFSEVFDEGMRASVGDFDPILPLTLAEAGELRAAITGGQFNLDGNDMQFWVILLTSGTYLYQFTLITLTEDATACLDAASFMAASFVSP